MYYCNDFNSLSVLSLYEGELLGVVDKLYFDKKLKKLIEIELIGEDNAKLILPAKNIYRVGKNAITVKNNQAVSIKVETNELCQSPINSKAYSINGEYLGVVKELTFNEKFVCDKISLDNGNTLDLSRLASCGKNTIIFYDNQKNVDIKKFTPTKTPNELKSDIVKTTEILPIEPINAIPIDSLTKVNVQNDEFLLGRICTKDIFNFNNEILIKNNCKINKKNLKEIKRFGKLRELMLFSK